jgi:ribosome-associated translation inhibitor RaiA
MTIDSKTGAFKKWQARQRELHSVETLISHGADERPQGARIQAEGELRSRAQKLRDEIERLFPSAMEELEESVRKLKDKRPRLHEP